MTTCRSFFIQGVLSDGVGRKRYSNLKVLGILQLQGSSLRAKLLRGLFYSICWTSAAFELQDSPPMSFMEGSVTDWL